MLLEVRVSWMLFHKIWTQIYAEHMQTLKLKFSDTYERSEFHSAGYLHIISWRSSLAYPETIHVQKILLLLKNSLRGPRPGPGPSRPSLRSIFRMIIYKNRSLSLRSIFRKINIIVYIYCVPLLKH